MGVVIYRNCIIATVSYVKGHCEIQIYMNSRELLKVICDSNFIIVFIEDNCKEQLYTQLLMIARTTPTVTKENVINCCNDDTFVSVWKCSKN